MEELHWEMRLDDREYFQTQLGKLVHNTPIELRSRFDQSLSTILKLNISSFEKLISTLQNSQLDENSRVDVYCIVGELGN